MRRPRLVVFFGGEAANHDLSMETGRWVCQYLPRSQYDITPVEITSQGTWKVPLGSLPRSGSIDLTMQRLSDAVPALPANRGLERLLTKPVDSVLTVVRGRGGDDGSLHGLGRLIGAGVAGSPYSTCQQTSDKYLFSQTVGDFIPTPHTRKFSRRIPVDSIVSEIQEDFLPPLFVKPANGEGSFGIEQITSPSELRAAISRITSIDDVLVQEGLPGTEFTVSLTQDDRGRVQVLPPTAIVPQRTAFYDQAAKRTAGQVALHTIDDRTNPVLEEVENIAREVYDELNCSGLVTIDVVANGDDVTVLEANTIPTFSAFTPLQQQLKAGGLHPSTMLATLVGQSLERKLH